MTFESAQLRGIVGMVPHDPPISARNILAPLVAQHNLVYHLREALRSVGNDYYTHPNAWPDHIRKLAYPEGPEY